MMKRYFFDFDDKPDAYGIEMPSAGEAFIQAVASMPEYVAELLVRDATSSKMTCTIREAGSARALYKIVMSMHVENADGETIPPPFRS